MGVITNPNTIQSGDQDDPTRDMANWNTIYNEFNGNIEDANVKNASITGSTKLIDATVTQAKVNLDDLHDRNFAYNGFFRYGANGWTLTNFAVNADATAAPVGIPGSSHQVKSTTNGATAVQELTLTSFPELQANISVVTCSVWCKSDSNTTEIELTDNADNSFGTAAHTGGDTWERLVIKNKTIGSGDTSLKIKLKHAGTSKTSYFTGAKLQKGSIATAYTYAKNDIVLARQDIAVNSFNGNYVTQIGWNFITGDGTATPTTIGPTFPVTFAEIPIVTTNCLGFKNTTDPTTAGDFTALARLQASAVPTVSGLTIEVHDTDGSAIGSGTRVGIAWSATGII